MSPPLEEKLESASYTTNQSSSSGSHAGSTNVWEERMKQRKMKQSVISTQTGPSAKSASNGLGTSPNDPKGDVPKPSTTKSQASQSLESDPSLEGIPNNTWLQRIYMLNGGERRQFAGRRASVKSEAHRSESHDESTSPSMGPTPSKAETTNQPWTFLPDEQASKSASAPQTVTVPVNHIVKSDGSYAPHRIYDPPLATMSGLGSRSPFMHSNYAPKFLNSRHAARGTSSYRVQPNRGYDSFRYHQYSTSMPNSATMIPYIFVPALPLSQNANHNNPNEQGPSPDVSRTGSSVDEFSGAEDDGGNHRAFGDANVPCYGSGPPYMAFPAIPGNSPAPYMVPVQPYMQMPYTGMWPYYAGQPVGAPVPPVHDTHSLIQQLKTQVEFYFSDENLASDLFLRQQMDAEGFVQLSTILGFKRVHLILQGSLEKNKHPENTDVSLLQSAIRSSSLLSLDAAKMRVRRSSNWQPFVLPSGNP